MRHVDEGQLHAWLDRDRSGLTASEAGEIERHLAVCAECRMRLDEARYLTLRTAEILAGAGPIEIRQPDFQILAGRESRRGMSAPRRMVVGLAWAASIVGAVGLGWWTREVIRPEQLAMDAVSSESSAAGEPARIAALPPPPVESAAGAAAQLGTGSEVAVATTGVGDAPVARRLAQQPEAPGPAAANAGGAASADVEVQNAPQIALGRSRQDAVVGAVPRPSPADEPAAAARARFAPPASVAAAPPPTSPDNPADQRSEGMVVRGRVLSEDGQPLSTAQVYARGLTVSTLSDLQGNFTLRFDEVPEGDLTIQVQRIGFASDSVRFTPTAGEMRLADIDLAPQSLALQSVVATGLVNPVEGLRSPVTVERAETRAAAPTARAEAQQAAIAPALGANVPPVWTVVSRVEAEGHLGARLLTIPELPILRLEMTEAGGQAVVRVTQRLESGAMLTLTQQLTAAAPSNDSVQADADEITVQRGDVTIRAAAPLDRAALEALLARLR